MVCLVLAAGAAAATLPMPNLSAPAAAQPSGADNEYRPCKDRQSIDVLLMMDESGSLNGDDGADPGGERRRSALQQIRNDLSEHSEVHVALVGFDVEPHRHAPVFMPASDEHPSDEAIDNAMGDEQPTDYGIALEAALEAFGGARTDSCRVMVWFTDGLHDPKLGVDEAETREAQALRTRLCTETKRHFEEERIQTFAVLLGDSFQKGRYDGDQEKRVMAQTSMGMIRAVTGHRDSPLVADIPMDPDCDWIVEQAGEILSVADVSDLPNRLTESIASVVLLGWNNCEELRDGSQVRSGTLPASVYIEEIQVFAYGGEIEGYDMLGRPPPNLRRTPDGSRRLKLGSDDLRGLSAGWELVLEVLPDPGGDASGVTLKCYSSPVEEPLKMSGSIIDSRGDKITELTADKTYTLRVDMSPFECPVDAGDFVLTPNFPAMPVRNSGCARGQNQEFEYNSGSPDADTAVTQFGGTLKPRFAENLWGGDSQLEVEVETDFVIRPKPPPPEPPPPEPPPPPPPMLDCDELGHLEGEYPGRVVAARCRVEPPEDGTATVEVVGMPEDLHYRLEDTVGQLITGPLELTSDDRTQDFTVVSEDLPSQGPWDTAGEVVVTLAWRPTEGEPAPVAQETITVPALDPLERYPHRPTLECSDTALKVLNAGHGEVPEELLRSTVPCMATGPGMGELRLTLATAGNPDDDDSRAALPESFHWLFETGAGVSEDGRVLSLHTGEELPTLEFVTDEPLDNERIRGSGTVTVKAVWLVDWQGQEIRQEALTFELDLRGRSNRWLAALIALVAAALTYALLYGTMAFSNRLPSARRFFATKLEFTTYRGPLGDLRSTQLESFNPEDCDWMRVHGDRRRKWLRTDDLRIDASHPRWWEVRSILSSGWGEPSLRSGSHIFGARPSGNRSRSGTTSEQFAELALVALKTGNRTDTPDGIAYVLVPRQSRERTFGNSELQEVLSKLTQDYDSASKAIQQDTTDDQPPDDDIRPESDDSPPPRRTRPPDSPTAQQPDDSPPPRRTRPPDSPTAQQSDDSPPPRRPKRGDPPDHPHRPAPRRPPS